MKLFYRTFGEGEPLVILHGLLGSSDNWVTLGKKFGEHFKVIIPDQRNHGNSEHNDTFSYESMVNDLEELIGELGFNSIHLIGHSMGGKVAMNFALRKPELIEKLIIVDIAPKAYPVHHDHLIHSLLKLDLDAFNSRNEVDEALSKDVAGFGERQFLLKNLSRSKEGNFEWKPNLNVIYDKLEIVTEQINSSLKYEGETLFVRGDKSEYILDEDEEKIQGQFINSKLVTVKNSGHWVHAEQPGEFYNVANDFLL